jgi:two-component system, chemotaxis family, response regulator Rcp1
LLVEDNHMDAFVIKEVLKKSGIAHYVVVAQDGESARDLLGLWAPDEAGKCPGLILLDLNLPKLSGIDLLAELRQSPRHRDIPVVVVTSSDSQVDRDAVRALNASAYFRKPSSLSAFMELAPVIRAALKH